MIAILGYAFANAGGYIISVSAQNTTDCDTAAIIDVVGDLPTNNSTIDSIVLSNSLVLPGGVALIGMTYSIYTSYEPISISLPVLSPFQESIILTRKEVKEGSFSNFGINVAIFSNGEYLEKASASYYYEQVTGCQTYEPNDVTSCDTVTFSIDNSYGFCSGYTHNGATYEVEGKSIYVNHNYSWSPFGPVCSLVAGPYYHFNSVKVDPLMEGNYEVITSLNIEWLNQTGGVDSTKSTRYIDVISVEKGDCPITGFQDNVEESVFYPSIVASTITVNGVFETTRIYSLSGQLMITSSANEIDVEGLKEGVYIIELTSENSITRKQFVKQ